MKEHIASCVQFAVQPNEISLNIDKACHYLEKAAKEYEAELIVFPESITTGFSPNMETAEFYEMLTEVPGVHTQKIQKLCKSLGVHVVYPLYERASEKNVILNSSVLIDNHGSVLYNYHKTHPFPTERAWTTAGNDCRVVDTALGKIGMILCYDGDFPELSRVLALNGAEIITRPSAFLRSYEIWEMTNKARAYDNHCYVLAANAVGRDAADNYYFGHSMIVSPIAQTLALARGTEEIIAVKLDPDPLRHVTYGSKSPMIFDHLQDRNVGVYKDILKTGKSAFEPSKRIDYKR
ncbi:MULTISPECIES: carbon-nitrogen hydrolase family protein [unclassified Fusibacter]|uniref:carbon-nitrogen hydrolase family protein n=1 Tax=unclassified Fusibacter TaxID=2624464 RepID=UPI001010EDBA|nr:MULTISPECIES: carbon-nitrogen hydrolase family protein [unclassified Fusibacter]MCK8058552.1 carbon-nitrogen hydrolase family protein [Fusibacter sp. A2]NPE22679.1 carbon-nitrogen hydrolase family protein [Fusibacter sp. A1]RXV60241.1 carbon-nitrogen hydrolase family protein [Fusibacter sp. A1]